MGAIKTIQYADVLNALERSLRAEAELDRCQESLAANGCGDGPRTALARENVERAREARETASTELHELITATVSETPWTVLLAGHLVLSNNRTPIIIPIEQVIHLDTLRRFP
jgi:hypothetical protein